jgi:hypothetical protein
MSSQPLSDTPLSDSPRADQVTLVVSLTATASARLTQKISAVVNRDFDQPYTFLGKVGDILTLDLHLNDPGLVATETLARRLLKIEGVKKLRARRICTRRGPVYSISLQAC